MATPNTPFHNSPQRYNQTRQMAAQVTQSLVSFMSKGPRTIIGTVADTSFHLTKQYVTCTTQLGIVYVAGVPIGTVIPGMRVYCRQVGGMSSTKNFVFDGYASSVASLGPNGSLIMASSPTLSAGCATVAAVTAQTGLAGPIGYYWHAFFYLPIVPLTTVTLFEFAQVSSSNTFTVQLLPSCVLQVISSDGHGYVTNIPIPPHQLHFIQIQPGNTGNEVLIDGIANYTGILSPTDDPTFVGGTNTYVLWVGANANGSQLLPVGSWVSKVGYGTTSLAALPNMVPAYDSDLLNASTGGITTKVLYLFEDTPGATTAVNSAVASGAGTLAISNPASIVTSGPY
jgi:hypothetical protein